MIVRHFMKIIGIDIKLSYSTIGLNIINNHLGFHYNCNVWMWKVIFAFLHNINISIIW